MIQKRKPKKRKTKKTKKAGNRRVFDETWTKAKNGPFIRAKLENGPIPKKSFPASTVFSQDDAARLFLRLILSLLILLPIIEHKAIES